MKTTTTLVLAAVLIGGCATDDTYQNEGSSSAALTKGNGGVSGVDTNFCNDPANPCVVGESDCDNDTQCEGALVCGQDNGPFFGYDPLWDVCVEEHCDNGVLDADEEQVDCGGVDCGPNCGGICDSQPPNGEAGRCTVSCPCFPRQGDCNYDNQCVSGAVCVPDVGGDFGFNPVVDMCLGSHCTNSIEDGDEEGVDCGPSCVPCPAELGTTAAFGSTGNDYGAGVAYDNSGNLIVVGRFVGTINVGGADLVVTPGGSASATDVFVAKYDGSTGAHIWSTSFGGPFSEGNLGLSVSANINTNDDIVVGGNFNDTVDFGTGPHVASPGAADAFVIVMDSSGTVRWSKSFGGAEADSVYDVGFDGAGNVVAVGAYAGTANFGGTSHTSAGGKDIFVAMYNALTGDYVRSASFGGTDEDFAYALGRNGGGLYIAGSIRGTSTFGSVTLVSNGGADAFVARLYRSSLGVISARSFGGGGVERARGIAVEPNNRVTIAGHFGGTVDFGTGEISSIGASDVFVHQTNVDLTARWTYTYGGASNDLAVDLVQDPTTRSNYVTGYVQGTVTNMPGGSGTDLGGTDAFVAILDANGSPLSSTRDGGTENDTGAALAAKVGRIASMGGFGGNAVVTGESFTSVGGQDIYLTQIDL